MALEVPAVGRETEVQRGPMDPAVAWGMGHVEEQRAASAGVATLIL